MEGFKELLGVDVVHAEEGEARLQMRATAKHLNPHGTVHGGVIATLADCAMGEAVRATGNADLPVTVEMKINYLEAGKEGVLLATARVHKYGRSFKVLEADVTQEEDGTLVAFATGTFTSVD
jgi:acyl-CoA thioesterase